MECEWQKRGPRHAVDLIAAARRDGGSAFRIQIADISYEGCRIRCDEPLEPDELIFVIVPRMGEIIARVKWILDGKMGLSFVLQERAKVAGR